MSQPEFPVFPDFPRLFETIGGFLRDAKVPKGQRQRLVMARHAFDIIARTVYSPQAEAYPCYKRARISAMPLRKGYPCYTKAQLAGQSLAKGYPCYTRARLSTMSLSRAKK